jgi:hypothetical protein
MKALMFGGRFLPMFSIRMFTALLAPSQMTETWQFMPGDTVRCKHHVFAGGERRLVAYENSRSQQPVYENVA